MAHLPPKVPNMIPNFSQQQQPQFLVPNINTAPQQQNSWIDEFLDFSSIKRGAHRRSASDSIAFLETPFLDEEFPRKNIDNNNNNNNGNEEFGRLDEEQLFSMFSDDISGTLPHAGSSSNPSTPSDRNSINDEKPTYSDQQQQIKNESGEVQSQCDNNEDTQAHMQYAPLSNNSDQPFTSNDPKRVRRILANRQSAQRSRVRKLQYISELERSVTSLQTEVSALSPRVAFLDHQRLVLNVDNSALKQRIAALAQDKMFKDAQQEALRKEIERLRHLYQQQNIKKIGSLPNQGCTQSDRQQIKGQEHVLC